MRNTLYVGLILTLLVCNLFAQQNTAQLNGTVQDASGAVIPAATVSVSRADTGFLRTTQTNERGAYALPFLPPGTYDVKVEAKGFSTVVHPKVDLVLGRFSTINFTVQPGSETQVVNVTGEAPLVDTSRSEIAGNVSPVEMRELPIADRNFSGLMSLIPGVRPAEGFDPTKTRSGNVSVNGSDGRSIDYNVDGGDNKDNVIGGIVQNFTMEGIQEFNVVVNRYSAESGRASSAVVNVLSKSGTNSIHGTVLGQFQNSALNKNNFFRLQSCKDSGIAEENCPKPLFHRYHFGGSVGGPVIKDKFFFFGAYEQKREPGKIPVDSDAFRQLSLFPLATPVSQVPFPYLDHLLTVKLDYHISNRQTVYMRYGREKWTNPNDQLGNPIVTDLSQTNSDTNQFHDLAIGHNFTLAGNKVNSLTVHFQDFVNSILSAPGRTFTYPIAGGGVATNPEICFISDQGCGSGTSPEIGQNVNVPQQTLIRKYQLRDDFSWTVGRHNQKFGVNWIYLAKLGGFFFFGANGYQVTFFDKPSDILGNTAKYPQGFATPGAVQSILFSGGSGSTAQPPAHSVALYYQDDFKVTPRLTLNLGVRWDANPRFLVPQLGSSPTNSNRAIDILRAVVAANPSVASAQQGLARARQLAGNDELLRKRQTSWKEFQPRIGFVYDPSGSGKFVIRGGYGISRDQVFQNLTLFAIQQTQPTIYQTVIDLEASHAPPACAGDPFVCKFRFGVDPLPAPAPGVADLAVGATGRILEPHITDPLSQQASIGTAIQLGQDFAFSADYYHVLGTSEPRVLQMNPKIRSICDPAFPGSNPTDARCVAGADTRLLDAAFVASGQGVDRIGELRAYGTNNRSLFDSFNFQLQKRMSHNFTFQASYVLSWSRSWGGRPTASYSGSGINITPEQQFRPEEFGPTTFDERHRFVVSGFFHLPAGFEMAPIFQAASARPYSFNASTDIDGDGRSTIDRVCVGSTPQNPITTLGCTQVKPNTLRGDPYINLDLRTSKVFKFSESKKLTVFYEFFNLLNRDNFCNNFSGSASEVALREPQGYCGGQGFGPAFSGQLKSQYGLRVEF